MKTFSLIIGTLAIPCASVKKLVKWEMLVVSSGYDVFYLFLLLIVDLFDLFDFWICLVFHIFLYLILFFGFACRFMLVLYSFNLLYVGTSIWENRAIRHYTSRKVMGGTWGDDSLLRRILPGIPAKDGRAEQREERDRRRRGEESRKGEGGGRDLRWESVAEFHNRAWVSLTESSSLSLEL